MGRAGRAGARLIDGRRAGAKPGGASGRWHPASGRRGRENLPGLPGPRGPEAPRVAAVPTRSRCAQPGGAAGTRGRLLRKLSPKEMEDPVATASFGRFTVSFSDRRNRGRV
ncbi:collagen alpha-1(VII) chain-like [Vulpes lagopus]|uniref:collagen alpha-1(VII) chain-like n=1 Tax=Vulpes lagopus TaxID=494514 RepID=UPI001BC98A15|nr:collagen alpha-1(VII) chain-like [Vulpes lagopus]